jgi:glycerophosphoryl diester phosphodiesterase
VAELERTIPPEERRFLRIAHRGASAYAPENTLAAIAKAAELDADMVELDVQPSAEGVTVVIHDKCLGRATNGIGPVSEHTLAELKALDVGKGESIPTLEEAITACKAHKIGLYLELKSGSVIRDVVRLIKKHQFYEYAIVSSFRPDWLADIKALETDITTSIIFNSISIDAVKLAEATGATYIHPAWEGQRPEPHHLLTPEWIANARNAKLGIIIWHEERPSEIAALRKLGVDGICSNAPDLLI